MIKGSTKLLERFNHTEGILRRIVYPNVEILRVTRFSVLHDREPADDQVFNLEFV
jgi:hypothetical protein